MAGAGYKLFNTGDVLTAAQVNTYLNEQTVMVFASSAARTSALSGVLAEGMMSYLQDTNAVQVYNGSAWVSVGGGASPLTTKGDLYTFSTVDARLGVGANGTVLTAASGEATGLQWAAAGGYTLISSGSLTGSSVSITSIPATYYRLAIFCNDFYPSVDDSLAISVNSTTGIYATTVGRDTSAVTDTNLEFVLPENQNNAAVDSAAVMYIDNYANTTSFKTTFQNIFTRKADDTNFLIGGASGMIRTTSAISSIQIKYQAGSTHQAGTYAIYGVK